MPFQPISDSSSTLPEVPFLNEWKNVTKNDGNFYTVLSLLVSSKGIILFTDSFKVFVWKSSKVHNTLLEHVGSTLSDECKGAGIVIQCVKVAKNGFIAGLDDSIQGYWESEGTVYTFTESSSAPPITPTIPELGGSTVNTSPKNGRRAS